RQERLNEERGQTSWSEREIGPVESELERYFSAKASQKTIMAERR
ncbi:unnamed protein product, partial [Ascophyllum nodosum]